MKWKERLNQLRDLLNVLRDKVDPRQKFNFLFSPTEMRSASNLTPLQAEFVEDANLVVKYFPRFQPLKDLADEILITTPSIKGKRVEDAINFQKASSGASGQQIGIFPAIKEKLTRKESKEKLD